MEDDSAQSMLNSPLSNSGNDGKIPHRESGLQKYAEGRGLVKGQGLDKGRIYLTRDYCNEMLDTVSKFLNQLHSAGQQLEDERLGAVE